MKGSRSIQHQNRIGGRVFVHQRRKLTEPGETFIIALDPVRGPRWESAPLDDENVAYAAARILADFVNAVLCR